jgi:hypothetical protein
VPVVGDEADVTGGQELFELDEAVPLVGVRHRQPRSERAGYRLLSGHEGRGLVKADPVQRSKGQHRGPHSPPDCTPDLG